MRISTFFSHELQASSLYNSMIIAKIGIVMIERTVDSNTVLVANATSPLYCWLKIVDAEATGIAKLIIKTFSNRVNSPAQSFTITSVTTGTISSLTKEIT